MGCVSFLLYNFTGIGVLVSVLVYPDSCLFVSMLQFYETLRRMSIYETGLSFKLH